jgi:hypothetical protein
MCAVSVRVVTSVCVFTPAVVSTVGESVCTGRDVACVNADELVGICSVVGESVTCVCAVVSMTAGASVVLTMLVVLCAVVTICESVVS